MACCSTLAVCYRNARLCFPAFLACLAQAESPFLSPGAPRENGNRDATHDVTRDGDARPHPSSLEAYAAASGRAAHWEVRASLLEALLGETLELRGWSLANEWSSSGSDAPK